MAKIGPIRIRRLDPRTPAGKPLLSDPEMKLWAQVAVNHSWGKADEVIDELRKRQGAGLSPEQLERAMYATDRHGNAWTDDPEDDLYYILDTRQVVGNCVLWWAKEDCGYTTQLDEAGVYTREQALERTESGTHVAYPKKVVDALTVIHVRGEPLHKVKPLKAKKNG